MKLFTSKKPVEGTIRNKKVFAFLPTKVWERSTKTYQWIWLERYQVNETYMTDWRSWSAEMRWVTDIRFI